MSCVGSDFCQQTSDAKNSSDKVILESNIYKWAILSVCVDLVREMMALRRLQMLNLPMLHYFFSILF